LNPRAVPLTAPTGTVWWSAPWTDETLRNGEPDADERIHGVVLVPRQSLGKDERRFRSEHTAGNPPMPFVNDINFGFGPHETPQNTLECEVFSGHRPLVSTSVRRLVQSV
jgi:hypothetical protein